MTAKKWDRDKVIKAIQQRQREGSPLTKVWKQDTPLKAAAKYYFGSWRMALVAAGCSQPQKQWSKQKVIAAIQARERENLPLRSIKSHDPSLSSAAYQYFCSWDDALKAAGVKLPPVKRKWNRNRVIQEIHRLHRQGIPVGQLWKQDQSMVAAAFSNFGSWRAALEAAGLNSERQQWSRQRVILELQNHRGPTKTMDGKLVSAAIRYFGTLTKALVAAGLRHPVKQQPQRRWTRKSVMKAIQSRETNSLTTIRLNDPRLYAVARRMFGSWRESLRQAGFEVQLPVNLSRDEVIQRIASRSRQGLPLVCIAKHDRDLYRSAKKHFGSWPQAMLAAGQIIKPKLNWSKQKIIDAMVERHRNGSLSATWREDKALFSASVRHFGNWQKALAAAGLPCKPLVKWSRERIIRELQACHKQHQNVRATSPELAGAAYRFFGSMHTAMEAAGIATTRIKWPPKRVIDAIQDAFVRGRPVHLAGCGDTRLACAARNRFGSWKNALEAAGLGDHYIANCATRPWSKQFIIAEILALHRRGVPPNHVWKQDPTLYSAAKRFFGTWQTAVQEADFSPTQRAWSKPVILADIRKILSEGVSPSSARSTNTNLTTAAVRYFGSWAKALEAAGVTQNQERSLCHGKK